MSLDGLQNEEEIICRPVVACGGALKNKSKFMAVVVGACGGFLVRSSCNECPWGCSGEVGAIIMFVGRANL